jgi:hypothetical protein
MTRSIRASILAITALSAAVQSSAEEEVESFKYSHPIQPSEFMEIVPARGDKSAIVRIASDAYSLAELCPDSSEFHCVASAELVFAVPRDLARYPKGWAYDNVSYEIVGNFAHFALMGVEVRDVVLIKAPSSAARRTRHTGEDGYFLYSASKGLLGFEFRKNGESCERSYFLRGDQGFGARK